VEDRTYKAHLKVVNYIHRKILIKIYAIELIFFFFSHSVYCAMIWFTSQKKRKKGRKEETKRSAYTYKKKRKKMEKRSPISSDSALSFLFKCRGSIIVLIHWFNALSNYFCSMRISYIGYFYFILFLDKLKLKIEILVNSNIGIILIIQVILSLLMVYDRLWRIHKIFVYKYIQVMRV
jgi:hypothetical protein